MKKNVLRACTLAALLASKPSLSFDLTTHVAMTSEALKASKFGATPNTSEILKKLGLYDKDDVFRDGYNDFNGVFGAQSTSGYARVTRRKATNYELGVMEEVRKVIADIPQASTIRGWLHHGYGEGPTI